MREQKLSKDELFVDVVENEVNGDTVRYRLPDDARYTVTLVQGQIPVTRVFCDGVTLVVPYNRLVALCVKDLAPLPRPNRG